MSDLIGRALAARKPAAPRVTLAYHASTGQWDARLFDGGEEIALGVAPKLTAALEALAAFAEAGQLTADQALARRMHGEAPQSAPEARQRRSRAALLD